MRFLGKQLTMLIVFILGACTPGQADMADQSQPNPATVPPTLDLPDAAPATPEPGGISLQQLRSADYQLGLIDQIRLVPLLDGVYQEGKLGTDDYLSVRMMDVVAYGDLNGDNVDEAVTIVRENYGGANFFSFVTVFENRNDEPSFLTSTYLDDRPGVNSLSVSDGEIYLDAVVHGFNDPLCCPALPSERRYILNRQNLVMTDLSTLTPVGDLREIIIEDPPNGSSVSGIINIRGSITIAPFENNLVYRIFDMGGVELTTGPINVDAADLGAPGTFDKAVDLGQILSDTTIRIVVQDINVADGSLFAMDSIFLRIR